MKIKAKKCVRKKSHHWILPPPNGRISIGVCKYCNKKQEHQNSLAWSQWETGRYHHGYNKPNPRTKSKK